MAITKETIRSQLEYCEVRIAELEAAIPKLPEGRISCYQCGKYTEWVHVTEGKKRTLIPSSNSALAKQLMLKRVLKNELHDISIEAEACRKYLDQITKSVNMTEQMLQRLTPASAKLLSMVYKSNNERIAAWKEAPYKKNTKYPEGLKVHTLDGGWVRSKLEADFAYVLTSLGLPYRYEEVHVIGGTEIAADFTILDPISFSPVIAELYGMMDNPDYRNKYLQKESIYIKNGYIPGVNKLNFYETKDKLLDMNQVRFQLKVFFGL